MSAARQEEVFWTVHYANNKVGRTINDYKARHLQEHYGLRVSMYVLRGDNPAEALANIRAMDDRTNNDGGWSGDCTRGRKISIIENFIFVRLLIQRQLRNSFKMIQRFNSGGGLPEFDKTPGPGEGAGDTQDFRG